MKKDETKGMNRLTMNQKYAEEIKKPVRKKQVVDEPKYEGPAQKYEKK